MEPVCYSQRLLNPFRGVMNVIAYMGAEAVATDGIHWDIYVGNTDLVKDLANASRVQVSDIRYGSWSLEKGLKRGPLFPSDDFRRMEMLGDIVYAYLLQHHQETPFSFSDDVELWLLDEEHKPLALLSSVCNVDDIDHEPLIDWRAGQACRKNFRSKHLPAALSSTISAGDYLTSYINRLAGKIPSAQWFKRDPDGSGEGLIGVNMDAELYNRHLIEVQFPRWFVRDEHNDDLHNRLVNNFNSWQAPWLLLLHSLKDTERAYFEQASKLRAITVDEQCRLYPEIVDKNLMKALRVEALLRRNTSEPSQEQEVLSPYYLELSAPRSNQRVL